MDFGLLLRRASLVFAIVAIGAGLMVYFLHDWFHSDFLNSFDVAQPLGDAIGTVIIVVVAYLAQRRGCAGFCVNGHLAGNCRPVRSHHEQETRHT